MNRNSVKILLIFWVLLMALSAVAPAQDEKKLDIDLRFTISQIAKANLPAVVHIKVTRWSSVDPLFMFSGFTGSGSGFIIDKQGHVLTNSHIVGNAQEIRIILSNHQSYPARLLGQDGFSRLAVLQITGKGPFPCRYCCCICKGNRS